MSDDDKDLIEALRLQGWDDAADLIEELELERDYIDGTNDVLIAENQRLEAELAKAVEIGNKMAASIKGNYYIPNVVAEWNAVLAELEKQ